MFRLLGKPDWTKALVKQRGRRIHRISKTWNHLKNIPIRYFYSVKFHKHSLFTFLHFMKHLHLFSNSGTYNFHINTQLCTVKYSVKISPIVSVQPSLVPISFSQRSLKKDLYCIFVPTQQGGTGTWLVSPAGGPKKKIWTSPEPGFKTSIWSYYDLLTLH